MKIEQLKTPAALLDSDIVDRNTRRMAERISKLGAKLRPHVKTHKTVEGARLQVRGHFGGITVSTLAEARHFSKAGFTDITWAFPLPPTRIEDARAIEGLNILLDHEVTLKALEASGGRTPTFLKVDCGDHRAGVDPEDDDSVRLALKIARSPAVQFRGILTHAGHSYGSHNVEEIRGIARKERDVMVRFAAKLREAGIQVPEVSVGSTPTMSHVDSLEGITEARPGNYAFFDLFQASIGSCSLDDLAFSILVTVAGHYPAQNKMIIDAGALALSKDTGARHVDADCGFGRFVTPDGTRALDNLRLTSLSQEHGQVFGRGPIAFAAHPIGSKLRIYPNHACLTSAMYPEYHVLQGGDVVGTWAPVKGW